MVKSHTLCHLSFSPHSRDLYWEDKLAFCVTPSVRMSVCLSVKDSGVQQENGTGYSHQIFMVHWPALRMSAFALFRGWWLMT